VRIWSCAPEPGRTHEQFTANVKYFDIDGNRCNGRALHFAAKTPCCSRALLQIEWREQGGPPVALPGQRRFGSKLIESSVRAELGGSARLVFEPVGLSCDMLIPLETAALEIERGPGAGHECAAPRILDRP
jgi:two-component sensor histidine kinase